MTALHTIDVDTVIRDNPDIFDEMVAWLEEVVGPVVNKRIESNPESEHTYRRQYIIKGTGWQYEYDAIRFFDNVAPETYKDYRAVDYSNHVTFYSKKISFDDVLQAVEFRLRW